MGRYKIEARIGEEEAKYWETFRSVVLSKYGKLHGVLGHELIKAIWLYLEHEKASNNIQKHTRKDVNGRIEQIMRNLRVDGYGLEVAREVVERYIREIGIRDTRTVNKYFKIMIDYGFLKHKAGAV